MTKKGIWFIFFVLLLGFALWKSNIIASLFGPPKVDAVEIHSVSGDKLSFAPWTKALQKYVKNNRVNYQLWQKDRQEIDATLKQLATMETSKVARDHLLAAYINAYNAFTVELILEQKPGLVSIKDIPSSQRWNSQRWSLGGKITSLNDLEHSMLRKEFIEPRIHFAIVCASKGCPPL